MRSKQIYYVTWHSNKVNKVKVNLVQTIRLISIRISCAWVDIFEINSYNFHCDGGWVLYSLSDLYICLLHIISVK